jgi:predicted amidohydrolase
MTRKIRAASVQFNHAPGDKAANLEKIRGFVERAERHRELHAYEERMS